MGIVCQPFFVRMVVVTAVRGVFVMLMQAWMNQRGYHGHVKKYGNA